MENIPNAGAPRSLWQGMTVMGNARVQNGHNFANVQHINYDHQKSRAGGWCGSAKATVLMC